MLPPKTERKWDQSGKHGSIAVSGTSAKAECVAQSSITCQISVLNSVTGAGLLEPHQKHGSVSRWCTFQRADPDSFGLDGAVLVEVMQDKGIDTTNMEGFVQQLRRSEGAVTADPVCPRLLNFWQVKPPIVLASVSG